MEIEQEPISKQDIEQLLTFLPYFLEEHEFGKWEGGKTESGSIQMPYIVHSSKVHEFRSLLYDSNFMVVFDWGSWDEGREIASDPVKVSNVDLLTLRMLMTAIVRNDRFSEGAFLSAIADGLIADILQRLQVLLKSGKIESSKQEEDTPAEDHANTTVKTYAVERTTEEGPYEMKCPDMQDAESLFKQVKDHVTTLYTRLLVNGKEIKVHKSERNMIAASDDLVDD